MEDEIHAFITWQ